MHFKPPSRAIGTVLGLAMLISTTSALLWSEPASAQGNLSVSTTTNLNPDGSKIHISGSGFNTDKGIYVALCVIPVAGKMPQPCGGGAALEGSTGASQWISSHPPSYGEGLAIPYGPGGTFSVDLVVNARISPSIDCRSVRCAITTRRDHMSSGDRSQDVIIPVTFAASAAGSPTAPVATTPPATPVAPSDPTTPAPQRQATSGSAQPTWPVETTPAWGNPDASSQSDDQAANGLVDPADAADTAPDDGATSEGGHDDSALTRSAEAASDGTDGDGAEGRAPTDEADTKVAGATAERALAAKSAPSASDDGSPLVLVLISLLATAGIASGGWVMWRRR